MDRLTALIIAVTVVFSPLASFIAFLITYDEYEHHLSKKDAFRQALQMAIFTLVVFIVVGLVSGYIFNTYIDH